MSTVEKVYFRACEHLDRISASNPSRDIVMDLLDAISDLLDEISTVTGEVERLSSALLSVQQLAHGGIEPMRGVAVATHASDDLRSEINRLRHENIELRSRIARIAGIAGGK